MEKYEKPEIKYSLFRTVDVVSTSGENDGGNSNPDLGDGDEYTFPF